MLARKTVFVLGAGASVPYGFPSGAELLMAARESDPDTLYVKLGERVGRLALRDFKEVLLTSQSASLDALLEHRPQKEKEIGKLFMAAHLLEKERNERGAVAGVYAGDWFSHLFGNMVDGISNIEALRSKLNITFVTYNYDRLVERKLGGGLWAHYGAPLHECSEMQRKHFPIIHLHGSLGSLEKGGSYVPFGCGSAVDGEFKENIGKFIGLAASSIQIVHEATPDTPEFRAARNALTNAELIFFLGFGFGRVNVDRLGFENINRGAQIWLTSRGMTRSEWELYAMQPLDKFGLKYERRANLPPEWAEWDCLQLLRERIGVLVKRYD